MADDQITDSNDASGLRKQLEAALSENKQFKSRERQRAFKDAGYDPDAGNGKALAKLYDGDADPESIRAFAKAEFGWEPPTGEGASPAGSPAPDSPSDWDKLNQATATGGTSSDPTDDDRIAKAEAEGDWSTYDRLQAIKLQKARR